ncbi:MAG TPA: Asd/ArgC dimerization domain-containing protein, partial [Thermoanaerobaculia bacterium]|nr:Asd/ArgC dimerization domain-containing protein [Thermoanaerobaculia bacterium]
MAERNFDRRSPADGYRIGIVNPTTLVGRELASILEERGFPAARIVPIDATGENEGTLTEIGGAASVVLAATPDAFDDLDLVFFCGPAEKNAPWLARHHDDGFIAIDLSETAVAPQESLPIVAGVNSDAIGEETTLILSAAPFVLPLIIVLDAVRKFFPVESAIATVTRPASHFDQKGIDEMYQQTVSVLNLKPLPREVFDRQTAFTAYSPADAEREEALARGQLRAILGGELGVSLMLTQASLFHGHAMALYLTFREMPEEDRFREILGRHPAIYVADEADALTTADAAGKDEVIVGRIARDERG